MMAKEEGEENETWGRKERKRRTTTRILHIDRLYRCLVKSKTGKLLSWHRCRARYMFASE